MTINLLHWVAEGIVLCCDSMVTLASYGPQGVVYTHFEHAEKLIPLGNDLPAAVMISGMGEVVDDLVSVVVRRAGLEREAAGGLDAASMLAAVRDAVDPVYRKNLPVIKDSTARQLSHPEMLTKLNDDRAKRGHPAVTAVTADMVHVKDDPTDPFDAIRHVMEIDAGLDLVIASFFGNDPSAWVVSWPGPREDQVIPSRGHRVLYWGSGSLPVARILDGYDRYTLADVADGSTEARAALDFFRRNRLAFAMPAPETQMPLQTAVDFADFLGGLASDYDHFSAGPSFVGGELDIMVLTPGKREWVSHKRIRSRRERRL